MDLVERRRAERFTISLKGKLLTSLEREIVVRVINLSFSGIKLQVATNYANELFPNLSRKHPIDTVQFDLSIFLPEPFMVIKIRVGVIYLRRISLDELILGCRFENFYQNSADRLAEYLTMLKEEAGLKPY